MLRHSQADSLVNLGKSAPNAEPVIDRSSRDGQDYRYEHIRLEAVLRDMYFSREAPGPGEQVPDFDLPMLGGARFGSAELSETGPTLLVFGSSSCPVTDSAAKGLRRLHTQYGARVRFVMVNVREAHPGAKIAQPQSLPDKTEHARRLRDLHDFAFEVAVDDVDGGLHRALSPKPNSAYIIGRDGTILFRALWANDELALGRALNAVSAGETLTRTKSGGLLGPMLKMIRFFPGALDRAGRGAWADMWRTVPPLAATAWLLKVLGLSSRTP